MARTIEGGVRRSAVVRHAARLALFLLTTSLLLACSSMPNTNAIPELARDHATVSGIENARYWLDSDITPFVENAIADLRRQKEAAALRGLPADASARADVLAISGGGEDAAFSVGLLKGWSAHGDRPEFRVVTGVSAGGLLAPFAFLGPDYDDLLHRSISSIGEEGVFRSRGPFGLLSDGMSSNARLMKLVEHYVTPQVLLAVAAEYGKGRALMIGTTELYSGRSVTWNMGAIAASGSPDALTLFRKVMVASASIPGAVSPVLINVELDGRQYQEMHVDGGVSAQAFTYPSATLAVMERLTGEPFQGKIGVYVLMNGKLLPEWSNALHRTVGIGSRALSVLLQRQAINDLDRIHRTAHQDGAEYRLAFIGPEFRHPPHRRFDRHYMARLFEYAYQLGARGYPWQTAPPVDVPRPPNDQQTLR
ncbi:patatin-like phospholipase family protein [Stenotrophomonas sp. SY1]|uniref:patatin-like phospholipase family protein n=1 Tax=Stenotrophomonas sp. SY1 TaxID=477235 RepID=UPI001E501F68|nr:patatin-like phospholipase family protein [Stenotrophomonas sp. SY1]MCD9087003.1 patatin-like phospholipase family protein [Stenotrophomonas sp. SY1]